MAPLLPMEPLRLSRTNAWISRPPAPETIPSRLLSRACAIRKVRAPPLSRRPLVVQRGGGRSERAVAGDFPTAVVHHAELAQEQSARRGDQALSAIDQASRVQIERNAGIADQVAPVMLVQPWRSASIAPLAAIRPAWLLSTQAATRVSPASLPILAFRLLFRVAGTNLHGPLLLIAPVWLSRLALLANSGVARQSAALIVQGALAGHCQCPCAG